MLNITYDHKDKLYKWVDQESGQVFTAPAKQKHELFRAVVAMLDPDLYQSAQAIIGRHPQLERGVWKAVEIVCNQGIEVYAVPQGDVLAMVNSSDGYGRYALQNDNGYITCQCPHFTALEAPMIETGEQYCKHKLAYRLYLRTRETRF